MPRKPRKEEHGAFHHVWARGNNREEVFRDNGDRQVFLVVLKGVLEVYRWRLLAYCLMGNHFHVVVMTPVPNLRDGMQRLNSTYGTHVNRRYDRSGHVFKRPFGSERIKDDAQLETAIAYVAANPVTAGLSEEPGRWRWSSHGIGFDAHRATLIGGGVTPPGGGRRGTCDHPPS